MRYRALSPKQTEAMTVHLFGQLSELFYDEFELLEPASRGLALELLGLVVESLTVGGPPMPEYQEAAPVLAPELGAKPVRKSRAQANGHPRTSRVVQ